MQAVQPTCILLRVSVSLLVSYNFLCKNAGDGSDLQLSIYVTPMEVGDE
jgi:hypothetical protein